MQDCSHLLYISLSEDPMDPLYIHDSVPEIEMDDDDRTVVDALEKAFPSSDEILLVLGPPAPAALEVYVVYRVTP